VATLTLGWPLTADFDPVGGVGVSGTPVSSVGNSYAGFAGGEPMLLVQSGATSASTGRYLEVTISPAVGTIDYAPTGLFLRWRRRSGSGATGWQVRSSLDGYTAIIDSATGTNTAQSRTVDLSSLGTLTAPVTLRIYAYGATGSGNGLYIWDWALAGEYDDGTVSLVVEPGGIASTLLVGSPALTLSAPAKVVRPSGVASALAVGTPSFSVVAPAKTLRPAGIASTAAVGLPWLHGVSPDPTEWVPLPNADDVLAFLGWPAGYEGQVQAHVDVVTALARAYTRRNAFGIGLVRSGVRAVIVAASARLVANPEQHSRRIGSLRQAPGFEGWTLAERAVLNDYRKVAR